MEDPQVADANSSLSLRDARLWHLTKSALVLHERSPHVAAFLQTNIDALFDDVEINLSSAGRTAEPISDPPRSRSNGGNVYMICSACGWMVRKENPENRGPIEGTNILHECPKCFKNAFEVSRHHSQPAKPKVKPKAAAAHSPKSMAKPESHPEADPAQVPKVSATITAKKSKPWKDDPERRTFNNTVLERERDARINANKKNPKGIKRKSLSSMLTRSKRAEAARRPSNSGLTLLSLMKP